MTYPPPGGTPDPYQPQQPHGQPPSDPTAAYQQDPYAAPSSGTPFGGQPTGGGQPYGAPASGQPAYGQPGYGQQPYAQPYAQQPYGAPGYPATTGTNVMAILSLVFAFIFAPAAIVLGHLAKRQIRQTGEQGSGLATAGLWLGYIFTGLYVAFCALWVVLLAAGVTADDGGTTTTF